MGVASMPAKQARKPSSLRSISSSGSSRKRARKRRRWSASSSVCPVCASRASIWRWRRWRRSSFSNGASRVCPGSSTITTRARSRCRPKPCSARCSVTGLDRDAGDTLSRYADDRRGHGLDCLQHRARADWIRMWMAAARHGTLRRSSSASRLLRAKLLAFAVSSVLRSASPVPMMVFIWFGAAEPEAFNSALLPDSVHDHHQRTGLDPRRFHRRSPSSISCRITRCAPCRRWSASRSTQRGSTS